MWKRFRQPTICVWCLWPASGTIYKYEHNKSKKQKSSDKNVFIGSTQDSSDDEIEDMDAMFSGEGNQ